MNQNMITEMWLDCVMNDNYEVSNFGNIRNKKDTYTRICSNKKIVNSKPIKLLGKNISKKGYYRVNLKCKTYFVHRLIALTFLPNPLNLPQINHKDGNKLNNNIDNLEWCNNQQNREHAINLGLQAKGEQISKKLTENDVINILNLKGFLNTKDIAKQYNINRRYVNKIFRREVWKHIPSSLPAKEPNIWDGVYSKEFDL